MRLPHQREPSDAERVEAIDGLLAELAALRAHCTFDELAADLISQVDALLDERLSLLSRSSS